MLFSITPSFWDWGNIFSHHIHFPVHIRHVIPAPLEKTEREPRPAPFSLTKYTTGKFFNFKRQKNDNFSWSALSIRSPFQTYPPKIIDKNILKISWHSSCKIQVKVKASDIVK